jgi:hypothetical protein
MSSPAPVDPRGATPARPAARAKRPLESLGDILPDLQEAAATRRPMWQHPAFLVSIGLALVTIIVMVVLLVLGVFSSGSAASELQVARTDSAVYAAWSGPDEAYDVYVIGGPQGDVLDVSQLVTGREVWIPLHARLIDEDACLLVRPAARNEGVEVGTTVPELEAQGAVRACIPDAEG